MSRAAANETKLRELLERGSLPASECGRAFLELVAPLTDTAVLGWERSGGGRRLNLRQREPLLKFIHQQYPRTATEAEDASSRVQAVARFRDTKALSSNLPETICLRAWNDGGLLLTGESVPVAEATRRHGVFAFLLESDSPYTLCGRCALVENPAVFTAFERLGLAVPLVIQGHGRISERLLKWLALSAAPDFCLLHLPDYDPVGLHEFQRLHSRLHSRVGLHLPPDLPALFARYANPKLLAEPHSQSVLRNLRSAPHPDIARVLALIDTYNGGLEQEALLID